MEAYFKVYVGSGFAYQDVVSTVLKQLVTQIQDDGTVGEEVVVQICDDRTARYSLGIFLNTKSDISSVQVAMQSFQNGTCLSTFETKPWQNVTFLAPSPSNVTNSDAANSTNLASRSKHPRKKLSARSDCTTVQVVSGDTCKTP